MRSNQLLMVFVRNPELGKVKTRLAETMGEKSIGSIPRFIASHQ